MAEDSKFTEIETQDKDHSKKVEVVFYGNTDQHQDDLDNVQEAEGSTQQSELQGYQLAKDRSRR